MKNEPIYNLLNAINYPEDLRKLDVDQLPEVCDELRQDIIKSSAATRDILLPVWGRWN